MRPIALMVKRFVYNRLLQIVATRIKPEFLEENDDIVKRLTKDVSGRQLFDGRVGRWRGVKFGRTSALLADLARG